ncbi:MAG: hypothetical protein KDK12_12355 [Rhodobacteraceae bacterium]|nr:hypothetical protein [Paracoccaceae bacterium]
MSRALFLAVALLLATGAGPAAACRYRFAVINAADVAVTINIADVQVRSRVGVGIAQGWGPWRRASSGGWFDTINRLRLDPGEEQVDYYGTGLLCSDRRQFRAVYICRGGSHQGSSYTAAYSDDGSQSEADRWVDLQVGRQC